jgi:hypothetical protein
MGTPPKSAGGTWLRPVLFFLSFSSAVHAQSDTAWLFRYPGTGTGHYEPLAASVDDADNVYVAGWKGEWGDNLGTFLIKVDSLGRLTWERTYEGLELEDIAWDESGSTYMLGEAGGRFCLLKHGSDGTVEWLVNCDVRGSIAIDDSQNVYVSGIPRSEKCQVRVLKYRPDGGLAGSVNIRPRSVDLTLLDDRFYILSSGDMYWVTNQEHPSRTTASYAWLVMKFSPEGRVMWERVVSETTDLYRRLRSSQVDRKGNIYLTGEVESANSSCNFCTVKMDSSGNILWAREYNGPENPEDKPFFLGVNGGNVLVSGWSTCRSRTVITVVKYDSLGNQLWGRQYGKSGADYYPRDFGGFKAPDYCSMNSDDSGNIYFTNDGRCGDSTYTVLLKYDSEGNNVWVRTLTDRDGEAWSGEIVSLGRGSAIYDIGIDKAADDSRLDIYVLKYRTR